MGGHQAHTDALSNFVGAPGVAVQVPEQCSTPMLPQSCPPPACVHTHTRTHTHARTQTLFPRTSMVGLHLSREGLVRGEEGVVERAQRLVDAGAHEAASGVGVCGRARRGGAGRGCGGKVPWEGDRWSGGSAWVCVILWVGAGQGGRAGQCMSARGEEGGWAAATYNGQQQHGQQGAFSSGTSPPPPPPPSAHPAPPPPPPRPHP